MGRYYYGNIHGKFWFGIQSSDDPQNLECHDIGHEIVYKVCHCVIDYENYDDYECKESEYCKDCYNSKEEHLTSILADDPEDTTNLCYEINHDITKWIAYSDDIENIKNTLSEIEQKIDVSKYIEDIDYSEEDNFVMNIHFTKEINQKNQNVDELLARWTLGKQILYYFEKTNNNECMFCGEN